MANFNNKISIIIDRELKKLANKKPVATGFLISKSLNLIKKVVFPSSQEEEVLL